MLRTRRRKAKEAAAQSGLREYPSFYRAYVQIMGHEPSGDRGMDVEGKDSGTYA